MSKKTRSERSEKKNAAKLLKGWQEMQAAAQGVYRMIHAPLEGMPALLIKALQGDAEARQLMNRIEVIVNSMIAQRAEPMCLFCDVVSAPGSMNEVSALVWVEASNDVNTSAPIMLNVICPKCHYGFESDAAFQAATQEKWREMMPNFRILPPFAEAGRA